MSMGGTFIDCKTLTVTTNGTILGTDIFADGKKVDNVVDLFMETNAKNKMVLVTADTMDNEHNEELCVFRFENAEIKI